SDGSRSTDPRTRPSANCGRSSPCKSCSTPCSSDARPSAASGLSSCSSRSCKDSACSSCSGGSSAGALCCKHGDAQWRRVGRAARARSIRTLSSRTGMAQAIGRLENGSPWGAKTAGESKRWTRRDWLKASAMAGASAGAGTLVGLALYPTLFGTPAPPRTVARESLVYTNPANLDVWWKGLVNREVSVTDFQEWQGASALWQGIFQDATWVEGTGLPVLVIRVKRDTANFGARMVHGPGFGPLPVVSVRADGDLVVGGMIDPRWYQYC